MENIKKAVPISEWVVTIIVLSLPIVNLVAALYWAFSSKDSRPESKRTFAKAYLIIQAAIFFIIMALFVLLVIGNGV